MEQHENPTMTGLVRPRQRRVFLDREQLELDAWRIETWYAHHGYFDAHVVTWDVRKIRGARHLIFWHMPPVVRIVGHLREGEPTLVTEFEWQGLEVLGGALISNLESHATLQIGDPLVADDLHATEDLVLHRLREQGYAFAEVESAVEVDPETHSARVRLVANTGPICTYGSISVSENLPVPEVYVRDELQMEEGARYKASELARTQRRLFGLGVFSVVNVVPDLSDPGNSVVPVRVELAPSKARQLRLGGGVLVESGKQDVHMSTDFQHVNLFGRLVRLETGGRGGYTTIAQLSNVTDEGLEEFVSTAGPTLLANTSLVIPRVPVRRWEVLTTATYEIGVEPGYRFRTPSVSPGLRGRLGTHLTLEFAWHLKYFDYIDLDLNAADLRRTPLALDFSDPYTLSYLRQQVTWDRRDDPLFPRRGLLSSLGLREAGGAVGGQYTYIRIEGDQRFYIPIRKIGGWFPRGTLAARVGAGVIQPYGEDDTGVPFAERLFLGGAGDVRGWPRRTLGPYLYACGEQLQDYCQGRTGLAQPTADVVPIGGLISMNTSIEVRLFNIVAEEAGIAVFTDAGMVWNSIQDMKDFTLLPTVGAGLRLQTPVGPLRLDLGYRAVDPVEFAEVPRLGVHFSLSEAF
jgi:translocation and assembly module TamA